MPVTLAGWATALDLTGLDNDLALAVRHYLARNREIREPARSRLGYSLASEVAACTTPPPPPGTPGWAYLAAILAERNRRAVRRLAQARAATATVWPELTREVHGTAAPMALPSGALPVPTRPAMTSVLPVPPGLAVPGRPGSVPAAGAPPAPGIRPSTPR
jgi:hypothetical protein